MRPIDADKIDFNEVFVGASDFARDTREAAQSLIDAQPTIEAVPVVHGRWKYKHWCCFECSECKHEVDSKHLTPYCPDCGAKMKGGK